MSLLDLNADCLHQIASYLPLNDLIKFTLICKEFDHIIITRLSHEAIVYCNFRNELTFEETETILRRFGLHIVKLVIKDSINVVNAEFYWLLTNYCLNIDILSLSYPSHSGIQIYKKLLSTCNHIESLEITKNSDTMNDSLMSAWSDVNLEEDLTIYINKLTRLKRLSLIGLGELTGQYLNKLRFLKHFVIKNCFNYKHENLIRIFTLNKLETLEITNCYGLNDSTIDRLVQTQNQLTTLIYRSDQFLNLENITRLKSLTDLTISTNYIDNLIDNLARNCRSYLEAFRVFLPKVGRTNCFESPEKLFLLVNLRVLHLINAYPLGNNFLTILGYKLQFLEELTICFKDDELLIRCRGIGEFLKNARSLKKLVLQPCDMRWAALSNIDAVRYSKGYGPLSVCFCGRYQKCSEIIGDWSTMKTIKFKCEPMQPVAQTF